VAAALLEPSSSEKPIHLLLSAQGGTRCQLHAALPHESSISADLSANKNQDARYQRQDSGHDDGDTDVKESRDSNQDQVDCKQKHSEIFCDHHAAVLRDSRRLCTRKVRAIQTICCCRLFT